MHGKLIAMHIINATPGLASRPPIATLTILLVVAVVMGVAFGALF